MAMRKQLQYFKYASFFTETAENKLGIDSDTEHKWFHPANLYFI